MKRPTFSLTPEELAEMPEEYQRAYLAHEGKWQRQKAAKEASADEVRSAPLRARAYRQGVANHEAAHLVAAMSVGAPVFGLRICTDKGNDVINGTGTAKVAGYCAAEHANPVKNALIGLAGWAWDETFDDPYLARGDYADTQKELSRALVLEKYGDQFEAVKSEALALVQEHEQLIREIGAAILDAAKVDGTLYKKPWSQIQTNLRSRFRKHVAQGH